MCIEQCIPCVSSRSVPGNVIQTLQVIDVSIWYSNAQGPASLPSHLREVSVTVFVWWRSLEVVLASLVIPIIITRKNWADKEKHLRGQLRSVQVSTLRLIHFLSWSSISFVSHSLSYIIIDQNSVSRKIPIVLVPQSRLIPHTIADVHNETDSSKSEVATHNFVSKKCSQ